VQGKYPLQPKYDSVPGHEGVGKVVVTGNDTCTLKEGDLVVPLTSGLGTWRTCGANPKPTDLIRNMLPVESSERALKDTTHVT
jgi:threonine dehydrogenase-like Zn-dependent dehydrogenase